MHRSVVDAATWGLPLRVLGRDAAGVLPRCQGKTQRHHLVAEGGPPEEPIDYRQHQTSLHVLLLHHTGRRTHRCGITAGSRRGQFRRHHSRRVAGAVTGIGFEGKRGKYLVLPDHKTDVPTGYIPVRPKNGMCGNSRHPHVERTIQEQRATWMGSHPGVAERASAPRAGGSSAVLSTQSPKLGAG